MKTALIGLVALVVVAPALAQEPPEEAATRFDDVVTVATRTPRAVNEVAGTVTSMDADEIEAQQVRDIRDLVRYQPGISVDREASRFGLGGFNIRGVDANRVHIEVDGVPVSDGFVIGNFSNASRDFVDPDMIQRVEVLRGPASALYGSDAIGGVVTFTTRDPLDLLGGDARRLRARTGYDSADSAWTVNGTGAFDNGSFTTLASYTRREGSELDNNDAGGRPPNEQGYDSDAFLGRLVHYGEGQRRTRLTVDYFRGRAETTVTSLIGGPGRFASTTALTGDDEQYRFRLLLDGDLPDGFLGDSGIWRFYWQESETDQRTHQELAASPPRSPDPTARDRLFRYSQDTLGGEYTGQLALTGERSAHQLTYGVELTLVESEELRDGLLTNLSDGSTSDTIIGETFPLRDFPISESIELGAYLQDEILFDRSDLRLIPALRIDHFDLDPKPDAMYSAANPNTTPTGLSETAVTPRLGLVKPMGEDRSLFLHYARGFRAPPFNDVNIGLDIPLFGVRAIPNPDLRPETSDGIEFGYRQRSRWGELDLALFYNDYQDLIESRVPVGVDPADGFLVFQSVNRAEAEIYGAELRGSWWLGALSESLTDLRLDFALAYADGEDSSTGLPLDSLDPMELVAGLSYSPSPIWDVTLIMTAVDTKGEVDQTGGPYFVPPGYAVFDLIGTLQLSAHSRVQWGIYNLGDLTYHRWSDVRGLPVGDPTVDLAAQPGINASVSVTVEF